MLKEYVGIILKRRDMIRKATVKIQFPVTNFT